MPKVTDRKKFKEEGKKRFTGGRYSDWKKEGQTIGYLHPQIGVWERYPHGGIPSLETDESGKEVVKNRRPNCQGLKLSDIPNPKCPACVLSAWAVEKIEEGADKKEVILEAGRGDEHTCLKLEDLAGDTGYRNDPSARREVAFVLIPTTDDPPDDIKKAIKIHTEAQSVGDRIFDLIDSEVVDRGELRGDPRIPEGWKIQLKKGELVITDGDRVEDFKPYPIKLEYREKNKPDSKYSARKVDRDLAPLTSLVQQVMLADAGELDVDMNALTDPADVRDVLRMIRSTWESRLFSFNDFEEYFQKKSGTSYQANDGKEQEQPRKKQDTGKKERSGKPVCRSCGNPVDPDAAFCARCGAKQVGATPEPEKDEPAEVEQGHGQMVYCPDCEKKVHLMMPAKRCEECGKKFDDEDVPF